MNKKRLANKINNIENKETFLALFKYIVANNIPYEQSEKGVFIYVDQLCDQDVNKLYIIVNYKLKL
jgi:hypothetical protein